MITSVLGISRAKRFSPNSEGRDAAIFSAVAKCLRGAYISVETVDEEDLTPMGHLSSYDAAFTMARSEECLTILAEAEAEGLPIINSPSALLRNTRARLTDIFRQANIPIAPTRDAATITPEERAQLFAGGLRYWLKRGDACAQTAGDVRFIATQEDLEAALADFSARGVASALLSQHVEGDLVKFYGVEGALFFHVYYPTDGPSFSKFGLERHNGRPVHTPFSRTALNDAADEAARLSGFTVYGGDAVVRPDGSFLIIDFNDWPSFSRCRDDAAEAIAGQLVWIGDRKI